nr:ATP-binding protein [uncultured Dorea sp.]
MGMQIHGIYRQDVYELPTDSVRELIANAVAHRSYLEPGNIQVAIFDDRLEVTSPGMLLNNVSIKKMMEGYSKPRNPAIANAFAYMKIIEKWGTGIPRIFRECAEYGLHKPKLIDFDGDFRVNMYRKSLIDKKQVTDVTEKVTDIEAKILKLISDNPAITTSTLANMLSVTRKTISTHMKIMKKNNVIERVGSDRKGYWKIL